MGEYGELCAIGLYIGDEGHHGTWSVETNDESGTTYTLDFGDGYKKLYAFFNFSEEEQPAYFDGILSGKDLVSGDGIRGLSETLKPYGFLWILCDNK